MTEEHKGSAQTTAHDHLRSMLGMMKRGARINLSGIPGDTTMASSNFYGGTAKEMAALIEASLSPSRLSASDEGGSLIGQPYDPDDERFARLLDSQWRAGQTFGWNQCYRQYVNQDVAPKATTPIPASGDQMEVVACISKHWLDYIAKHAGVNIYVTTMRGGDRVPLVTLEAAQKAIADMRRDRNRLHDIVYSPGSEYTAVAELERAEAQLAQCMEALKRIAEGNLGPDPWQANYDRIRQVASEALQQKGGQSDAE